jgi:poly-gamma-glutamate synthase PgsB/CapB
MRELILAASCFFLFLIDLAVERFRLDRARRRVPLRVAVTGTRGKSSMTRLIAAGLRESGVAVLAKTTGSRATLILPNGSEVGIARPGGASIREQVRVVERAAALGAGALVIEMMSIGRECLAAESRRIVRPGLLALTNVRLDHLEEMGHSKAEIARTLSASFPEGAAVFLPAEECQPVFEETAARLRSRLVQVGDEFSGSAGLTYEEFEPNVRLALAVLQALGVDRTAALRGMGRVHPDFGSLRVWSVELACPPRACLCVSAFAANDPESSSAVVTRARGTLPSMRQSLIGLLCLREDRGDRTMQWVRAAGSGFFAGFDSVAVVGRPAPAALRRLRKVLGSDIRKFSALPKASPAELMRRLIPPAGPTPVVIGLGNIGGYGEKIIDYWENVGTPYAA